MPSTKTKRRGKADVYPFNVWGEDPAADKRNAHGRTTYGDQTVNESGLSGITPPWDRTDKFDYITKDDAGNTENRKRLEKSKGYVKGGKVRGDGCCVKGKTKGRFV